MWPNKSQGSLFPKWMRLLFNCVLLEKYHLMSCIFDFTGETNSEVWIMCGRSGLRHFASCVFNFRLLYISNVFSYVKCSSLIFPNGYLSTFLNLTTSEARKSFECKEQELENEWEPLKQFPFNFRRWSVSSRPHDMDIWMFCDYMIFDLNIRREDLS